MTRQYYKITYSVKEYVLDALEKAAEIASTEKGREVTADDIAKAIMLSVIGREGEKLIY
jgi:histone H3/H4